VGYNDVLPEGPEFVAIRLIRRNTVDEDGAIKWGDYTKNVPKPTCGTCGEDNLHRKRRQGRSASEIGDEFDKRKNEPYPLCNLFGILTLFLLP
jgi:hypothetical protein